MTSSSAARAALHVVTLLALALMASLATAADDAGEGFPEPPPEPVLESLDWKGNDALGRRQLEAVVFTRGPTWKTSWKIWKADPVFSESALIGDMVRIQSLYQLHGYYEAQASYTLVWNDDETRVAVTIRIDEGLPVLTEALDIALVGPTDLDGPKLAALLDDLPLEPGERFSPKRYARTKEILLDRMAENGYPMTRIEGGAEVEVPLHSAAVRWRVRPGPLVHFGDVTISGLYLVNERTARRELKFTPGDRYATSKLTRTRLALQRQGLYSWVSVQVRPPETDSRQALDAEVQPTGAPPSILWPVEIKLTERSPYTVDMGLGYSSDESGRISLGWRNGNFLGDARKLRLTGLWSGILSKAEVEFTQPYFFDPKLALIARFSFRHETEPGFTADRILPSIGLSRSLGGPWRARVNYEFSYNDITRTAFGIPIQLDEPEGLLKVGTFEFGIRRQTIDDLLNPTRGTWFDFVFAPSIQEFGSDFDYLTYLLELRGFLPIGPTVLAGRFRIGAIQPIRETTAAQIPLVSRIFSGGSNSHRGFRYHRMPPVGSINPNVGGTSLLEASVELRFPIWRKIGGVLFVDTGVLDLEPFSYPLDKLYWAVGPGLRYDTIVGPLRLDFGALLNPRRRDREQFQWFISVGQSF
jgi:outer membrane protein assembly factor BamA